MTLSGQSFIGGARGPLAGATIRALNPATGEELEPVYYAAGEAELQRAVELAAEAFATFRQAGGPTRAKLLRRIADRLEERREEIAGRAHLETALPMARLLGEVGRTTGQLRLFASVAEEGSWVEARLDAALPDRAPQPRPDLRSMLRPLGPVAVFGASNFPLAFSTAGGDTASALAAGCPVIFKAHSAHPGTSELVAEAIGQSIAECGLPEGVFSLLYDAGTEIGAALVRHPLVQAVAFTGSHGGGRRLMDLAASRPQPIPCFTEMSSANPMFVLPGAFAGGVDKLAQALLASFTLGAGQFCTKPGIVFLPQGGQGEEFVNTLGALVAQAQPFRLLTPAMAREYARGARHRATETRLAAQAGLPAGPPACAANAQLFLATLDQFLSTPSLAEEIFGPQTLLVLCDSTQDYARAAASLSGQLTASIFGSESDLAAHASLVAMIESRAGRLIFNAFPTGVEVSDAMVHGGPYPATSDARFTSVGTRSIYRFARPVCFQSFPDALLPAELQSANPLGIERLVNGASSRGPLA